MIAETLRNRISDPKRPLSAPKNIPASEVRVPKGLIFPINPQGTIRLQVTALDGESYTLLIGDVEDDSGSTRGPQLTLKHWRLLIRILALQTQNTNSVAVGYSDLLTGDSGIQRRILNHTLADLANTWIHKISSDGKAEPFRLLELNTRLYRNGIDHGSPISRRYLKEVRFNIHFWRAFQNWGQTWRINPEPIIHLSSDVAAACYLLLTPKAHNPAINEQRPARKDAAAVLTEIGVKVPTRLSALKDVFTRIKSSKGSVLEQLNGQPTSTGWLKVDLEKNCTGTGYNLVFWISPDDGRSPKEIEIRSVLQEIWRAGGLPLFDFQKHQNPNWKKLDEYEVERLSALRYPVERNRRYLEIVRSFIGPIEFACVIGEAADAERTERIQDSVEAYIGGGMRNAFRNYVRYLTKTRIKGTEIRSFVSDLPAAPAPRKSLPVEVYRS